MTAGKGLQRVESIVRTNSLDSVKQHLVDIGVDGMTVSEVRGFGRQKEHTEHYRGAEYSVDFVPKIMVTILATEDRVDAIVKAITEGARTGKISDGKIFSHPGGRSHPHPQRRAWGKRPVRKSRGRQFCRFLSGVQASM